MSWFIAKLIFKVIHQNDESTLKFDEQLRLIQADNQSDALTKALEFGRLQESKNNLRFINISELYPLAELKDGTELHYQVKQVENAELYVSTVHRKGKLLETSLT